MHRVCHRLALAALPAVVACGGGKDGGAGPDAGRTVADPDAAAGAIDAAPHPDAPPADAAAPADAGSPDAAPAQSELDHFGFAIDPATPRASTEFELEVRAYRSADDSELMDDYDGTVSVTASAGTLGGDASARPIAGGVATFTLHFAEPVTGVTLTVTDDLVASATGTTAPFDVDPEGDVAAVRDVVVSEVNWFGNESASGDEWIELRNTTAEPVNVSGWTVANGGGVSAPDLALESGTVIGAGAYLVLASEQGPDTGGERTSVTGVSPVQIQDVGLVNTGEVLELRDAAGAIVDVTPGGDWPAGDNDLDLSMERRDDLTGGGYADGGSASSWSTWNEADGRDTTSAATTDRGTPGADNTDPEAIVPPEILPYSTAFEPGDPAFEIVSTGTLSTTPPDGVDARSGAGAITTDLLTTSFSGRQLQSEDCLALTNATDPVDASMFATSSTANGATELRGRVVLVWFTDEACATPANAATTIGTDAVLPQGSYTEISASAAPPAGATHLKIRLEARDDSSASDAWAADDAVVRQ